MSDFDFHDIAFDDFLDRGSLTTEKDNSISSNIHRLSTDQLVDVFVEEDKKPQIALLKARKHISKTVDIVYNCLSNNGRLFYIGAGTSGRLAVLDAAECPPTFCTPPDLVQAVIAGGDSSLFTSSEGIEDSNTTSIKDLKKKGFSSTDCLIGISAGGTTPYVLSALNYAKSINASNIFITCVPENELFYDFDVVIRLITGPELISGSTRLKAGTATKMALNIISSAVMIKLGKVFRNKMVDLSIKNKKLLDRSIRILTDLLEVNRTVAYELLRKSNGSVKISCIMNLTGLDYTDSKKLLADNDQHLYRALKEYGYNNNYL